MTETEWLAWESPERMLRYLRQCISSRKLRLFIAAKDLPAYKFMHPDSDRPEWPTLQEVLTELGSWSDSGVAIADVPRSNPAWGFLSDLERRISNCRGFAGYIWGSEWVYAYRSAKVKNSRIVNRRTGRLLTEIIGNPFRDVTANPSWLTSTVLALAEGIYADHAFDRLPVLADALQDAGCDSSDILDHCRDTNGVHVRGCWVVDMLLGKS